ncbi:thiamine pyrophosphate-dependent dehydrogenase E1 component subunit alpha [Acidithiobacillus caldus]|uniref:thiamine pyrophosphate-dependent dehydrogenase E1 component subunit alpha n=1 Tax=Acidithiobacillus caldus TaxID=33059 RepID=UPI001C0667D2|nr:thiamine pyrophosphate-dependent enzyme [Acidithiobacillus caldus]MBU2763101.1 pyruvate dehydrogenase (acetyl-transferring) E1 component subunit alpha [Acidithiobacillus caldus]MBU2771820.1 pyruvate dehydrogenase (acetyl-transferring) E1 component subunit alpha [Acidithiobacillus caldus]
MDRSSLLAMLRDMMRARAFEEAAAQAYAQGEIAGFLHLYPGEEAVAVGVLHAAEPGDYVVSTYREHVHALVRGIPAHAIFAELMGKKTGISGGMGGSMHLFDRERRFLGGYAIVGETFPIALGAAYAVAYRRLPEAVLCFFGDGAVNQGTFHESLNMAALWRLPILFVCENNHYQIGTEIHRHSALTEVYKRACAYGIPAEKVDGMEVLAVFEATRRALTRVRTGDGPQFLEMETYRYRGHSMADPGSYRPAVEVQAYEANDPIAATLRGVEFRYPGKEELAAARTDCIQGFCDQCYREGHLDETALARLRQEIAEEIAAARDFARQSPAPTMEDAWAAFLGNRRYEKLLEGGKA